MHLPNLFGKHNCLAYTFKTTNSAEVLAYLQRQSHNFEIRGALYQTGSIFTSNNFQELQQGSATYSSHDVYNI